MLQAVEPFWAWDAILDRTFPCGVGGQALSADDRIEGADWAVVTYRADFGILIWQGSSTIAIVASTAISSNQPILTVLSWGAHGAFCG
jgi:hypothetical protein